MAVSLELLGASPSVVSFTSPHSSPLPASSNPPPLPPPPLTHTARMDYWQNILSVLVSVPASLASIHLLGSVPSRSLQLSGFAASAIAFTLVGALWSPLEARSMQPALFCLFLVAKFASGFGVPITTFLLPNELFPRRVRGSCNGLSAACGKVGYRGSHSHTLKERKKKHGFTWGLYGFKMES